MTSDRADAEERLARLERMIEQWQLTKRRASLEYAVKSWRQALAIRHRAALEARPERLH